MTIETFADVEALEACVGSRPAGSHLKSITHLDEHCVSLLAAASFGVVGVVAGDGSLRTVAVGGEPGVLAPIGRTELMVPLDGGLDVPDGAAAGLLVFVPGYRETLRINGRLRTGATTALVVEEAFLHCAKAVIRSHLWDPAEAPVLPALTDGPADLSAPGVAAFFDACPFVALSSCDELGAADVSPKGDPRGSVVQIVDDRTLAIADRPGNRRTDTMHNLITRRELGMLAFVPGSDRVVEVRGRAAVTADDGVRAGLAVNGKVPTAAIVLTVEHLEVRGDAAITAAALWDVSRHVDPETLPKATRIWVDHVKRNEDPGFAAKAARKLVNTKLMDVGIAKDYRDNLY